MKRILLFAVAALLLASCSQKPNTNAIWLWSKYMTEVDLDELVQKDIRNVILHEKAFTAHGVDSTLDFVKQAQKKGVKVHIWFQCFYKEGKWVNPVDDENNRYKQEYFDEVIARAVQYVDWGVDGIHLDYIRFGGTAHKHNPSEEITATGCVTEFCRQIAEACRKHNPKIVLSAALMPEPDSEYYYGQDPAQMGQYLDILMPMIYRHSGGYKKNDEGWAVRVANHFAEKGAPAVVWAGTTTYRDKDPQDFGQEDENPVPMTAEETLVDCRDLTTSKAVGIVLFRFGLGEIPDMHGLWD